MPVTETVTAFPRVPIPLVEYAAMHGRSQVRTRQLAQEGRLASAFKLGRNWVVDPAEPYPPDARQRSSARRAGPLPSVVERCMDTMDDLARVVRDVASARGMGLGEVARASGVSLPSVEAAVLGKPVRLADARAILDALGVEPVSLPPLASFEGGAAR